MGSAMDEGPHVRRREAPTGNAVGACGLRLAACDAVGACGLRLAACGRVLGPQAPKPHRKPQAPSPKPRDRVIMLYAGSRRHSGDSRTDRTCFGAATGARET